MQPPPAALALGTVSPDGLWRWNGSRWEAVAPSIVKAPRRSMLPIVGGIAAIVAEIIVAGSYLTPYVTYSATPSLPGFSFAVFYSCAIGGDGSCTAAPWSIASGVIQVVFGVVVAVLLIALRKRLALAVASGALFALGVHEFADWIGLVSAKDSGGQLGLGIPIGVFGGVLLAACGLVVAVSLAVSRPAPTDG